MPRWSWLRSSRKRLETARCLQITEDHEQQLDEIRRSLPETEEVKEQDKVYERKYASTDEGSNTRTTLVPNQLEGALTADSAVTTAKARSPKLEDVHCRRFDGKEVYPGLGLALKTF